MARVILILFILGLITSCEKECIGDCAEITIMGQALKASNNRGIDRVPIRVYWQPRGFGFFNSTIEVVKTRTNKTENLKFLKLLIK